MYLAARLFLFFAPSNHSIRNRHARARHVATNRIAMTVGTMSTRILAIRSRIGQRKSTATTCICVHSHRSSSPSDTSFQLYRRSFISVKLFVYLSSSKSSSHGTGTYAFVFYGTPSPARFLSCASWRDLSFTSAFIFYLPAFALYLPLIPTSLLHLSHSQYGGDFFWRIAHGFHKSLPRLDMTFLRMEIISLQDNNYPSFSSHLFRKKTPQITTKYKIRSSFISKQTHFFRYSKNAYFIKIISIPMCLAVRRYKTRNLTVFCAFEFTCT